MKTMNYVPYEVYGKAIPVIASKSSRSLNSNQREKLVTSLKSKLVRNEIKSSPSVLSHAVRNGNDFDKINLGVVEMASGLAVTNTDVLTTWLNSIVAEAAGNYTYDHPQLLAIARAMVLHPFRCRLNGNDKGVVVVSSIAQDSNLTVLVPNLVKILRRKAVNCPVLDFSELHADYKGNKPDKTGVELILDPVFESAQIELPYDIGVDKDGYFTSKEAVSLIKDVVKTTTISCKSSTVTGDGQRILYGRLNILVVSGGELGTLVSTSVPVTPDSSQSEDFIDACPEGYDSLNSIMTTRVGRRGYSYLCLDNQILESVMYLNDTLMDKISTGDLVTAVTTGRSDKLPALVSRLLNDNPIMFARMLHTRLFLENEENFADTAKFLQKYGSVGKLFRKHMSFESYNNIKSKLSFVINTIIARDRVTDLDLLSNGLTHGKLAMREAIDFVGGKSLIARSSALMDLIQYSDVNDVSVLENMKYELSQYALRVDEDLNRYLVSREKYSERETLRITISILEGRNFISFFLFTPSFSL